MRKLISMSDFVLELDSKEHWSEDFTKCVDYANFLKQPLTLGMFVPCDEDWNVLEEPDINDFTTFDEKETEYFNHEIFSNANNNFQQAKDRVLFDGFEAKKGQAAHLIELYKDNRFYFTYNSSSEYLLIVGSTVESLLKFNLTLKK